MGPGGHLEGSWRHFGALQEAWSAKGRLPGAYGALLDGSWRPSGQKKKLGSALGWPKSTKETGFALSEGQNSAQKRPRRVLKLVPKVNQAENWETMNIVDSTTDFFDF